MSVDEKQFRSVLGRFATGVCVVSAFNTEGRPIGMTINSFSSVSLTPCLVQWSISNKANTYYIFSGLESYSISFLSENQEEVSSRYARPGDHIMVPDDYLVSPNGIPFVKDALAYIECTSWQTYAAGDHDLVVAFVEDIYSCRDESPLVYYQGNYRALVTV